MFKRILVPTDVSEYSRKALITGYGIIAGAVIGSVSQHVLAQAHCPVLVVK